MIRRHSWIALVALACVVPALAACAEEEAPAQRRLTFSDCPASVNVAPPGENAARLARVQFQCGTLTVPLDHAKPEGETLDIAVIRARAGAGAPPYGSVVMNPGGPGQSGLAALPSWAAAMADGVLDHFDLVSFDPRGTGISAPINCPPLPEDAEPSLFPSVTEAGLARGAALNESFAASCLKSLGDRAPYFSTGATAQDLDLLRAALGEEALTYVGFSYGAKLGGEYARRFPGKVRAMVLDAPSDPAADPLKVAEAQVKGFETSFDAFAGDCVSRPDCLEDFGPDPRAYVASLVADGNRNPTVSRRPGDELAATGSDVLQAVLGLLYTDETWPYLQAALTELDEGDAGSVFEAIDTTSGVRPDDLKVVDPNDAGYVINCSDAAPGPTDSEVGGVARRLAAQYPLFGTWYSWNLFGCSRWGAERTVLPAPSAPSAPPLLVVGTVNDPATPYAGAKRFTEALGGSGTLLTWEGQGHTAYLRSPCVTAAVDAYLIEKTIPAAGTRCPA